MPTQIMASTTGKITIIIPIKSHFNVNWKKSSFLSFFSSGTFKTSGAKPFPTTPMEKDTLATFYILHNIFMLKNSLLLVEIQLSVKKILSLLYVLIKSFLRKKNYFEIMSIGKGNFFLISMKC